MEFDPVEREAIDASMTQFLQVAVEQILEHQDAERFLAWVRQEALIDFPELFGGEPDLFAEEDEPQRLEAAALAMGRALWNATPLPDNGYAPRTLPEPAPLAPCPCGSGEPHRRCCQEAYQTLAVPPEVIWPLLMELLPTAEAERVVRQGVVPVETIGMLAERLMEAGAWRKAARLIEPRFVDAGEAFDEHDEHLFEILMDAYLELGSSRKRDDLVKRLLASAKPPFRSVVWERQALMRSDAGDRDGAWEAFNNAQRDNPNSIGIGALEVSLLMADGDFERLRERSRYWLARLKRLGLPSDHPTMELFSRLLESPAETLAAMGAEGEGDSVLRLMALLDGVTGAGEGYVLEHMGMEHDPSAAMLRPSAALFELERAWTAVWPLGKPFSVNPAPFEEAEVWAAACAAEWLGFLEEHPEALGSLSILDDLAMGIEQLRHAYTEPVQASLWGPLLHHFDGVLSGILGGRRGLTLPWGVEENRPALRLLGRLADHYEQRRDFRAHIATLERLLQLNPNDNHGHRVRVINQRLINGDNEGALLLADAYPDDGMVDVLYGRALAAFRLERDEAAARAISLAVEQSPLVADYLLKSRVRKPKIDDFGVSVGGPDEAWLYRDAMRKSWRGTKGALEWLAEVVKG